MTEYSADRPSHAAKSCCEEAALNAAEVDRLTRERDELQAKLDAAEQRPTLDREAVRESLEGFFSESEDDELDLAVKNVMALAPEMAHELVRLHDELSALADELDASGERRRFDASPYEQAAGVAQVVDAARIRAVIERGE